MSLLQNHINYQKRIQGLGSNGTKKKVWKCPAGHLLQPLKGSTGSCDGCKGRVVNGEHVMECRSCNWYLCERCHPQEREPRSWLWGSVSSMAEKMAQEFTDLKEVAEIAETKGPLAACAAPPVRKGDETEIRVCQEEEEEGSGGCQAAVASPITPVAAPITPAGTAPHAIPLEQVEQATPPKVEAPKEVVDLLGLDFDPKVKTSAPADTADALIPLDLL